MQLEDAWGLGGCRCRPVEIDPVDQADEPDPEREASGDGTEDVAEEHDPLGRVQLGRADLLLPRRRTVIVASPAARRFRTQWTSPHGAQIQRGRRPR